MDDRAERIAQNEALFRSINAHINDLNSVFGLLTGTVTIVCECGQIECIEQIELDAATYETLGSDDSQFIMLPGHEVPELEQVVERHETFCLVRKHAG